MKGEREEGREGREGGRKKTRRVNGRDEESRGKGGESEGASDEGKREGGREGEWEANKGKWGHKYANYTAICLYQGSSSRTHYTQQCSRHP